MEQEYAFIPTSYENASLIWQWIPFDATSSGFKGSAQSLAPIQATNALIESYSPYLKKDSAHVPFCYDTQLDFLAQESNSYAMVEHVYTHCMQHIQQKKKILGLGGEHTISAGLIKAMLQSYPDLAIIHLDAHQDFRKEYSGTRLSHATVMHYVYHELGVRAMYQFGIRSCCQEEYELAQDAGIFTDWYSINRLPSIIDSLGERPIYLTLDVDILDPSYFPGTGTPEPGGISTAQLFRNVFPCFRDAYIVGGDVVEFLPERDVQLISTVAMCIIMREFSILLGTQWF